MEMKMRNEKMKMEMEMEMINVDDKSHILAGFESPNKLLVLIRR